MDADLKQLGIRHRRGHDLRRTFISLAREDGARKDILEIITHGDHGDIVNLYTTLSWATLCEEIAKLKIERRLGKVIAMPNQLQAVGDYTEFGTVLGTVAEQTPDIATISDEKTRAGG